MGIVVAFYLVIGLAIFIGVMAKTNARKKAFQNPTWWIYIKGLVLCLLGWPVLIIGAAIVTLRDA